MNLDVDDSGQLLNAVEEQIAFSNNVLILLVLRVWPVCFDDSVHFDIFNA